MKNEMVGVYANMWIRQKVFTEIGEVIGGHKHNYDHVSLLATGSVEVEVDGVVRQFDAPTFLVIRKDKVHNVKALTENVTWFCVFASRDINGEVYDPELSDPFDYRSATILHPELEILDKIQNITILPNNTF